MQTAENTIDKVMQLLVCLSMAIQGSQKRQACTVNMQARQMTTRRQRAIVHVCEQTCPVSTASMFQLAGATACLALWPVHVGQTFSR
jgi:hypothetical protein